MQHLLILAAESGEGDGALGVILPAAAELVYGFVAFVIVFLILRKVAFPRLNTMLDERSAAIVKLRGQGFHVLSSAARLLSGRCTRHSL